jgi:hypothetical protein
VRRSNHYAILGLGLGKLLGLPGGITTLRGLSQLLLEFEAWESIESGAATAEAPATSGPAEGLKHGTPVPAASPAGPRTIPRTVSGPASRKPRTGTRTLGGGGGLYGVAGGSEMGGVSGAAGSLAQGLGTLFSRSREMGPYPDSISGVDLNAPVRPTHFRHRGRPVYEFLPNDAVVPFDMAGGEGGFPLIATAFCEVTGQVYRKLADGTVAWSGPQADVSPALVQALRKADRSLKHHGIKPLAMLLTNVARKVAAERLALLAGSLLPPTSQLASLTSTSTSTSSSTSTSTSASSTAAADGAGSAAGGAGGPEVLGKSSSPPPSHSADHSADHSAEPLAFSSDEEDEEGERE